MQNPHRLLIAGCDETDIERCRAACSDLNCQIAAATDGVELLNQLPHFQPHLILLDATLANPSAYDLCGQIKSEYTALLVIVATFNELDDIQLGTADNVDDFVSKPINENELRKRGIEKSVVTVVTQVLVDQADPAFLSPTKPIGTFMTEMDAMVAYLQRLGTDLPQSKKAVKGVREGDENPFAGDAAALAEGEALYAKHCAICHGAERDGGIGPELEAGSFDDDELFDTISGGVTDAGMPSFSKLGADRLWKLVTFLQNEE